MMYRCDDLIIDTETGDVRRDGDRLNLQGLNRQMLSYLLERAPESCSHLELAKGVWGRESVEDATIAKRVSLLRAELGEASDSRPYLETFANRRYGMSHKVHRIEPASGGETSKSPHRLRTMAMIGVGVSLLVAAFLISSHRDDGRARLVDPETGKTLVAPE